MKKTYLILFAAVFLLIWFNHTGPAFLSKIRPKLIDFLELPLKAATGSAKGVYNLATFRNRYEKRISVLEIKLTDLYKSEIQVRELTEENERLRKLLLFKGRFVSKTVAAEVIARDPSNWDTIIIIDKGSGDGVVQDMTVAKDDGLVGRVYETGERTAKVMLIDNQNIKVGATVQRTREQGVLVGLGGGLCKLLYLSSNTQATPGDIVISSESSSLSTKGILIGEITKILRDSHSLYATAIVKPASNLFKIEEVLCIE